MASMYERRLNAVKQRRIMNSRPQDFPLWVTTQHQLRDCLVDAQLPAWQVEESPSVLLKISDLEIEINFQQDTGANQWNCNQVLLAGTQGGGKESIKRQMNPYWGYVKLPTTKALNGAHFNMGMFLKTAGYNIISI